MKIEKLLTLILLLTIFFSATPIFADGDTTQTTVDETTAEDSAQPVVTEDTVNRTTTSINKYFELELMFDSQNPLNKNLQYTLVITPKIDSPKTQILWDLPSVLLGKPKHKEFVSLQKDQTYSYRISIAPQREGIYDITANVISWQNEVNYTNSVSTTVTLDKSLVSQPVESSYTVSLILFIVAIIGIFAALIYAVYKLAGKGIKKLKVWLTPPY